MCVISKYTELPVPSAPPVPSGTVFFFFFFVFFLILNYKLIATLIINILILSVVSGQWKYCEFFMPCNLLWRTWTRSTILNGHPCLYNELMIIFHQCDFQAERQAVNTTVQGSAADLVKKAMVQIDVRLRQVFPSVQYTHRHKYLTTQSKYKATQAVFVYCCPNCPSCPTMIFKWARQLW